MSELLNYAIVVLIPFMVQLVILSLTANRFQFLRFAVPVLAVIAGAVFFLAAVLTAPPGWAVLLWWLALLFVLLGLALVMMGWMLAWAVYYLTKRKVSDPL